jgi:alpha-galactosidase
VYQPVGDTVMAGGISRAMRQIPPMVAIANDVHRLCPGAWFFNYANPMAAICRAVAKATPARMAGLCHGVQHTVRHLCDLAGAPYAECSAQYFGMNHLTWITHLTHGGESLWPRIEARCRELGDQLGDPFSWELYRTFGAFPAVLDRHVIEFFPERFPGGDYYGKRLGVDVYSVEATIEGGDKYFEHMAAQADGRAPLDAWIFERAAGEHEALVDILGSIFADAHAVFPMNVPNRTVAAIPSGFVLELPTAATSAGCLPMAVPAPPSGLAAVISEALWGVEITVDAALAGSRELFVQALLYDRSVTCERTAGLLADELIGAHRKHLPQFA